MCMYIYIYICMCIYVCIYIYIFQNLDLLKTLGVEIVQMKRKTTHAKEMKSLIEIV